MFVTKRDGHHEHVAFDKITARIEKLCGDLDARYIDPVAIAQKVVQGVYAGVTTKELDELAAQTAAYCSTLHPQYAVLAGRISVTRLHKETIASFSENARVLHAHVHSKTGLPSPLIADDVLEIVLANAERLDAAIDHSRDLTFDYFGFKTLERSYLLQVNGKVAERPQHMFMRVAVGMHKEDIEGALETYDLMSRKFFTHATPTLFNAGTPRPQLSSCFLVHMRDDSIEGIYDTLKQCALISKYAGGIGLSIHNIRATDSYIRGTNGSSNGIVPMLKVFSDTAHYVDQGGGKRKGSIAIYLEPWHADIKSFLDLKKNTGSEEHRARNLFYALWVPDLFMKRVQDDGVWTLMCPHECPGLSDVWGDAFDALYTKYEAEGRGRETVKAQKLWFHILESQVETGTPYILFKDACNRKSNQQHLGTIKSSNLCTEIIEYTSPDEVAVCNLASISLPAFVDEASHTFDFARLVHVTKVVTKNLNKVIDVNFYPLPEARNSNMRHRPVGLGVQGLADAFIMLRLPFDSPAAVALNRDIFEAMYFGALTASCELAAKLGPYESYPGSPASRGILQYDMWGVTPSERWDWAGLKRDIAAHGLRNSLLLAPMPTASTAQILGNNEGCEPYTTNVYNRRVLAGEFTIVNTHMLRDLIEAGLWTTAVRNQLIAEGGSIQGIACIPDELKALYKTVWEIKQKVIIDMAADRGAFICQSQSMNIHMTDTASSKLTSMHFYSWKKGLKTGMYYLRTMPKAQPIQFTVDQAALALSKASIAAVVTPAPREPPAAAGGKAHGEKDKEHAAPAAVSHAPSPGQMAMMTPSAPPREGGGGGGGAAEPMTPITRMDMRWVSSEAEQCFNCGS